MIKNELWISAPIDMGSAAASFIKSFTAPVSKKVKKAKLSVSSMGLYSLSFNNASLDKRIFTPGWTSYRERVQYIDYEVTEKIKENNEISITVAPGWALGHIGFTGTNKYYADEIALIAYLEIEYGDGSLQKISTDESWDVYTNEVLYSDMFGGETIDKTAEIKLLGKAKKKIIKSELIAQIGEDICEQERIAPRELIITPKGDRVIDFGQNMAGYVELSIKAPRGSKTVLHHAEVLDSDGNFYNANYRDAKCEMIYISSGGNDVFKPKYSFQGFRYVRLTEYPFEEVELDNFRAVAIHSDLKRTGFFKCGNEKINQLYHNIIWGQKSNYIDVPTDCPQRDERLGWTGDAQVFCRTAAINYDVEKFFKKWLGDVAIDQKKLGGAVPGTVPIAQNFPTRISAAWGDVACIAPWEMFLAYGNLENLRESFPMMRAWVDFVRSTGPEEYLWLTGRHYGDWLALDAGEDSYVGATSTDLIASAFFAHSTRLTILAGEALGIDVSEYRELYRNVRQRFREYFMENGMPKEKLPFTEAPRTDGYIEIIDAMRLGVTQTAITLILYFGLAEENEKDALTEKLVSLIRERDTHMATGFVGTPYILHALSENGRSDVAYELLFKESAPSWLYSVCHGATTMWEHWNSIKEDGSFWSTDMNSFNHYAYGAVFDWIFGVSAGIKPLAPAYKEILLAPHPDKKLGFADTSYESRSGLIRSYWCYKDDAIHYEFEVPQGVTAHIELPSGKREIVTGGKYLFAEKL